MTDWFRNWANCVPSAVIDTFFCHIEVPDVYPHEYYNPHYNGYGIKYQIVIAIGIPAICDLSHSFKGLTSDVMVSEVSRIFEKMEEDEAFLADKQYCGNPRRFVVPSSGHRTQQTEEDKAWNYLIYQAKQTVKWVIKHLWIFWLLKQSPWRYSVELHEICTKVNCKIVNFLFLIEPLSPMQDVNDNFEKQLHFIVLIMPFPTNISSHIISFQLSMEAILNIPLHICCTWSNVGIWPKRHDLNAVSFIFVLFIKSMGRPDSWYVCVIRFQEVDQTITWNKYWIFHSQNFFSKENFLPIHTKPPHTMPVLWCKRWSQIQERQTLAMRGLCWQLLRRRMWRHWHLSFRRVCAQMSMLMYADMKRRKREYEEEREEDEGGEMRERENWHIFSSLLECYILFRAV